MKNKERLTPVYLKSSGDNSPVVLCISYEHTGEYVAQVMKSISELKKNSNFDDFCVFDWDLELCVYPSIRIPNTPIYSKIKIIGHTLHYNASVCGVRSIEGCFRKIKKGGCNGCKDKFIIDNICKVFFADKYQDKEKGE